MRPTTDADADVVSIADLYDEVEGRPGRGLPPNRQLWVRGEIQSISDQPTHGALLPRPGRPRDPAGRAPGPGAQGEVLADDLGPARVPRCATRGSSSSRAWWSSLRGSLDFYPPQAEIGFIMAELDVTALLGRLAAQRAALHRSPRRRGLLEHNRSAGRARRCRSGSASWPAREPRATATSSASSTDSGFAFSVRVAPVSVQGAGRPAHRRAPSARLGCRAATSLVVVVRGGGSKADLAAFDAEPVARAIATSPVPVWTGIGHTGDESVADLVANRSFITPTECGAELAAHVAGWWDAIADAATTCPRGRSRSSTRPSDAGRPGPTPAHGQRSPPVRAEHERLLLDADRIVRAAPSALDRHAESFAQRARRLPGLIETHLDRVDDRVANWRRLLEAYDVDRQLERGYTITRDGSGTTLRSAGALALGATVVTRFADGTSTSTVTAVDLRPGPEVDEADQ